jgi:ubiquinone/menaquinone biosynthesis C-methylase UbiE
MRLGSLRTLLDYRTHYSCNDYSCSPAVEIETSDDFHIPESKYNIPFDSIEITKNSVVANLFSGLGYDIMQESEKTGNNGKVIGIDFSPAMMFRARYNVEKRGCKNVSFREALSSRFLPLGANIIDTLIFNKLLNRFPNKNLFSEIYRILKPGGAFYIYDIISDCPDCLRAGIFSKNGYAGKLIELGFKNIVIKEFITNVPVNDLQEYSDVDFSIANLNTALIRGEK